MEANQLDTGSQICAELSQNIRVCTEELKNNIAVKFFSNMIEEITRKYGPSTEQLKILEIEKENQRLQGHRVCAPSSMCPDAAQSRSTDAGLSASELTEHSTPKSTESHTEQSVEEKFFQLPFTDSKLDTSKGRVNCFRSGPAGQKHEMWGTNEDSGNVDLESNGLSQTLSSSSPEEVSFILRGATGHQRGSAFPKNNFLHQADPLLPNNAKAACKKPGSYSSPQSKPRYSQNSSLLPLPQLLPSDTHAGLTGASDHTDSVVMGIQRFRDMGVQRFRDMLKVPYKLELKNEPGRSDLKHIVIDGCNVAFTHGLHKFFSCRGIAIAVEYFWNLGHRNITVFVPQWRTRRNPNVKEQYFLTQLKEVGILSLTPSRMVLGERISCSHVDSFLLHLAHKTGGVIVSNDKFREFVTASVSWREIIAKRLLQYTFVGDIFMVPDNPLGRNGPRLKEFLRKEGPRDLEPLLSDLPNVDTFAQSHNTQVAITSYQPPYWNQGTSSDPWLPQQLHFISLASISNIEQNHLMPAQRSSAETSKLREALLKIFPDSEQKQKIEEILAAQPFLKDLNVLSGLILDLSLG
uniref:NEDD4-binding protein 1-like n=1 Tax=Myodes glareolus TaxID=447135 RepID=UPI00201FB835|nr:NEDD4-binding protein 1-like [Myodes glareolus]